MRIPQEKIEEIREAIDIVEVISQYVTLKKQGKSFIGLCPFHTEKTPSFSVDPVRGFYHCFGCGAGGNVFTFVMKMENVSFPEALRSLAERAGIPLPAYERDSEKTRETEGLYHANQFAAKFFQNCLLNTEGGKKALAYISKREFGREIIKDFQIGYAPDQWDGLLKKAKENSIRPEILAKAGLVVKRKDGTGYYDRFRDRIMFPILNPSGRVVGFGGRVIEEKNNSPKYLNSPETLIYQKSRILYGLFQSKTGMRQKDLALLVEGYTDVMRFHESGFNYAVASSGTALTEEQARLLSRYTRNVILVFDGDSAGLSAALRGVDILVGAGLNVSVVPLPAGSDPDSFLRSNGREAMEELLKSAETFIDFRLNQWKKRGKLKTPAERAEAARIILNTVEKIHDPLERNLTIKEVSEKLGVEESFLIHQISRREKSGTVHNGIKERIGSAREQAEEGIVKLLLEYGEKWSKPIFSHLEPKHFQKRESRILIEELYKGFLSGNIPDPSQLMDRHSDDPPVLQYLTKLLAEKIDENADIPQLGLDCVLTLRQEEIKNLIQDVRGKMKSAQAKGEDVSQYSREWIELKKKLEELKNEITDEWKRAL